MQYMLLIYGNDDASASIPEEERASQHEEYMRISRLPSVRGGAELQPATTATTIRVQDGDALTTDGPFVDTKEAVGGYYLIEAENLDEALDVAARIPAARNGGAVEVRPVVER
jgi:hypothetical protein